MANTPHTPVSAEDKKALARQVYSKVRELNSVVAQAQAEGLSVRLDLIEIGDIKYGISHSVQAKIFSVISEFE